MRSFLRGVLKENVIRGLGDCFTFERRLLLGYLSLLKIRESFWWLNLGRRYRDLLGYPLKVEEKLGVFASLMKNLLKIEVFEDCYLFPL